jgi:hypothetical protein
MYRGWRRLEVAENRLTDDYADDPETKTTRTSPLCMTQTELVTGDPGPTPSARRWPALRDTIARIGARIASISALIAVHIAIFWIGWTLGGVEGGAIALLIVYVVVLMVMLGQHGKDIRELQQSMQLLSGRLQSIEKVESQAFVSSLRHVTRPPMERVYSLGLWLYPKFLELAKVTSEEWKYAEEHGKFFRQLTLERWTNHCVVKVSEARASSDDPTIRSFNVYDTDVTLLDDTVCLWHIPLGPEEGFPSFAPALELQWKVYGGECIRLVAIHGRFGSKCLPWGFEPRPANILLVVPLDPEKLSLYKTPDDDMEDTDGMGYQSKPWRTSYDYPCDDKGISWTLSVRDFELWRAQ